MALLPPSIPPPEMVLSDGSLMDVPPTMSIPRLAAWALSSPPAIPAGADMEGESPPPRPNLLAREGRLVPAPPLRESMRFMLGFRFMLVESKAATWGQTQKDVIISVGI